MTGMLARSKLRTNLKKVLCCGCGAAIPLANGLRRRPVNTSLHAISAKNAIRESVVNAIQIPRIGNGVSRSAPMLTKFMLPAGDVPATANARGNAQCLFQYERLAQALLLNCSSVRLQGAANYRAVRCADELEAHLKATVLCDVSTGAGIHMERDG